MSRCLNGCIGLDRDDKPNRPGSLLFGGPRQDQPRPAFQPPHGASVPVIISPIIEPHRVD